MLRQTPPKIKVSQIKTLTLKEALAKGSLYEPCKPHIELFEKYGEEYGIPPILLAAFAMQESASQSNLSIRARGL